MAVFWALAFGKVRPQWLARPKKGASAATPPAGTTQPSAPPAQVRERRELTAGCACVRGVGWGGGEGREGRARHHWRARQVTMAPGACVCMQAAPGPAEGGAHTGSCRPGSV